VVQGEVEWRAILDSSKGLQFLDRLRDCKFLKKLLLHVVNLRFSQNKLRGMSLRANYADRAAAACRRSQCQLLRIEGCRVVRAADPLRP
jgi:hypothetical protein